jgi:hypothetical protein
MISLICYFSIIIFGFVPVSRIIEQTGFSTSDLQNAGTKTVADEILLAWQGIMPKVILLSILDYLFILSGLILFFAINSMIFKRMNTIVHINIKLKIIPLIGFILTIISRSMDSLENLWIILIYSNPLNYPEWLLPLVNYTSIIKWGFVALEYACVVIGLISIIVVKIKNNKRNHD